MKKLEDFADEINKCSKCGMCQSVCPVYKITGNECAVSKGKFVMLEGVLKGDLKLSKTVSKYMDLCLLCEKCSDFCPSSIDVCRIFAQAKHEYAKNILLGKIKFFLQSEQVFNNFLKIFKKKPFKREGELKLVYFKGCLNNIFPNNFVNKIPGIELVEKDFDCCGIPFLSSGNVDRYERAKKRNMELLSSEDTVLTDCASCAGTLKGYYDGNSPNFINLGELVVRQNMKFKFKKTHKVTFHKPCHLKNDDFLIPLLKNCENIDYVKSENYDDCCGFSGEFAIKNPKISKKILNKKAENIIKTNADIVITTCPSCVIGLKLALLGKRVKVMSLAQFLNSASIISKSDLNQY